MYRERISWLRFCSTPELIEKGNLKQKASLGKDIYGDLNAQEKLIAAG